MTAPAGEVWRDETEGAPPLVVFVHGSMDRSASFAKVARRLEVQATIRYDRRGYGRSTHLSPASGMEGQVDDLLSLVSGRPAVAVGHSIGGVIALAGAVRSPETIRAVVAYEAPMAWREWWPAGSAGGQAMAAAGDAEGTASAAERFMRGIVGEEAWERLPASTREARRAEGAALVADLRSIRDPAHPPYDPADLVVPVVAAHGTDSAPHHVAAARELARATGSTARVVDGAGHGAHRSHPDAFAALVEEAVALAGR